MDTINNVKVTVAPALRNLGRCHFEKSQKRLYVDVLERSSNKFAFDPENWRFISRLSRSRNIHKAYYPGSGSDVTLLLSAVPYVIHQDFGWSLELCFSEGKHEDDAEPPLTIRADTGYEQTAFDYALLLKKLEKTGSISNLDINLRNGRLKADFRFKLPSFGDIEKSFTLYYGELSGDMYSRLPDDARDCNMIYLRSSPSFASKYLGQFKPGTLIVSHGTAARYKAPFDRPAEELPITSLAIPKTLEYMRIFQIS